MQNHPVVSQDEWLTARKALLLQEKQLTKLQDELNAQRQALPWTRVEKSYVFDTPDGQKTLAELFDGRSQLFVYHFMFGPGWEQGCVGCSFFVDHIDGANQHLKHHDLTVVVVSRATLAELTAYKARMGWKFPWVSSFGGDFNYDYHVSFTPEDLADGKVEYNFETIESSMDELPGVSVFFKDEDGSVFHTYSSYARGDERGLGAYMFLDLSPKGRNETGPSFNLTDWVRRHDEYDDSAGGDACCA
jgi:predicted dithiol-disulfide oxidoreductase (DUF899 family)